MLDYFRRLFSHMRWADSQVLERLQTADEPDALRLLAHVLGATEVWLTRLEGRDSRQLEVWPAYDLAECGRVAAEVHPALERYLETLPEAQLHEPFEYRNQQGAPFTSARVDILTHMAMHGGYHRGQIARVLRLAGHEPVNTDFIQWVRLGG
jgi:uncharacterized damage-inducible protein DinB